MEEERRNCFNAHEVAFRLWETAVQNCNRMTGKPEVILSQKARWDILAC